VVASGLTKKAEPPPTRGVNRDSGTASANGGWLRRLVRHQVNHHKSMPAEMPACKPYHAKNHNRQCEESSKHKLPRCVSEIDSPTNASALRNKKAAVFWAVVCQGCVVCRIAPLAVIDVVLCHKRDDA